MVIQTSNVAMRGSYQFSRTNMESVSYTSWGNAVENISGTTAAEPSATDSEQTPGNSENAGSTYEGWASLLSKPSAEIDRLFVSADDAIYSGNEKLEYNGMKNLLMLLSGKQEMVSRKVTPWQLFRQMLEGYQERFNRLAAGMGITEYAAVSPTQAFGSNLSVKKFYEEKESTSFYSSGTVITEDGRQIDFDLEALMSRSFSEYTSVDIDYGAAQLMDPLVINLEGGTAQVSDKKFLFDIDCDGKEDNISLLAKGCGFLALDRNGDGKINDGSELFGTKSGNGFADLAIFDLDNNGWIDEKDEIFNHLRIWTKDEEGNDKLVALGVAGVGAIYLGSAATKFSLNSQSDNTTNAIVRSSGIYLRENGTAGVVQQVDLAVG